MVPNSDKDNNGGRGSVRSSKSNNESNSWRNSGNGTDNEHKSIESGNTADSAQSQAVDKAPGEERGKQEKVTPTDLKGKKVDGDPSQEEDKPATQK